MASVEKKKTRRLLPFESVSVCWGMDEELVLNIHKALHEWRDVEGDVDLEGDGRVVISFSTASNGCRCAQWQGHTLMEQNKKKATKWANMAKKGAKITWILTGKPWGLIVDDKIVRKCSAVASQRLSKVRPTTL